MIRMADLNFDVIRQAHADDQEAYKRTSASPQHLHRLWLLQQWDKLFADLNVLKEHLAHEGGEGYAKKELARILEKHHG